MLIAKNHLNPTSTKMGVEKRVPHLTLLSFGNNSYELEEDFHLFYGWTEESSNIGTEVSYEDFYINSNTFEEQTNEQILFFHKEDEKVDLENYIDYHTGNYKS